MFSEQPLNDRQQDIVDQSDDVRDPADDSDELNDPTALTDTYPAAFDDRIDEAEAAIKQADTAVRHDHTGTTTP